MLTGLSIRNVVLIEALDLDLERGLTAMTGETGAGKSIILDALGMATGARSDKGLVRSGAAKAQSIATFSIADDHPVWEKIEEADLDVAKGEELILRRTINADGRSRAFINDGPIGVKLLASLGEELLEVHGQHDGRGLLDPAQHIHMLDQFGGYADLLSETSQTFKSMASAKSHLKALKERADKAASDKEFLTHAIAELDRLNPKSGEEEELAEKRRFLQGAEGALTELTAAQNAMGEDGAFEARLSQALAGIERVRDKVGAANPDAAKALNVAAEALEKAMLETQEAREAVADAAARFDIEPGQLDGLETRLFALRAAARKYGVGVEKLAEQRRLFAEEMDAIDSVDRDLIAAEKAVKSSQADYKAAAGKLTRARVSAAERLDAAVMTELPPLKMERATFKTAIDETADSALGQDQVLFQVSTNPGTPIGALNKIASGGEMARFALAIKVALAGLQDRVMVFDEVDQGVGGAVADAVGRRLERLSQSAQVFVVTHSPQVAASAAQQYLIKKSSKGDTTNTHVRALGRDEREEEIARMLAGEQVTDAARAAARQLMSQ